jgi:hypothetical protein
VRRDPAPGAFRQRWNGTKSGQGRRVSRMPAILFDSSPRPARSPAARFGAPREPPARARGPDTARQAGVLRHERQGRLYNTSPARHPIPAPSREWPRQEPEASASPASPSLKSPGPRIPRAEGAPPPVRRVRRRALAAPEPVLSTPNFWDGQAAANAGRPDALPPPVRSRAGTTSTRASPPPPHAQAQGIREFATVPPESE